MASADDDRFRTRPEPPRAKPGSKPGRFVSSVVKQVSKSGFRNSPSAPRSSGSFGRGRAAAALRGSKLGLRARRVVIKSRFVVFARAGEKAAMTHLRYIERDGTTREGGRGEAYGPETDSSDIKAFEERGRGDRHQFRMIISVEDASQLDNLPRFTREFMKQLASDLETPLDWVAVDHWDTDNPHTHVVLRGRSPDGRDLVIAPDYMAHGMRMRASDIVTQWLGPRTEIEIRESLRKEIAQERLTNLDRTLLANAKENVVNLNELAEQRRDQLQLRGRLERLEIMGLARRLTTAEWRLASNTREVLVSMGERGDILRTVNLALNGALRDIEWSGKQSIVGRVAGKGIADELSDRTYLIVDGTDGKLHYARLGAGVELSEFAPHAVVEVQPGKGGLQRARVLSVLSVQEQIHAEGPTWLDRQLIHGALPAGTGFAEIVRSAIARRSAELAARGLMDKGTPPRPRSDLIAKLRAHELTVAARNLSSRLRKPHVEVDPSAVPRAKLTDQLRLASGRFAILEWERGFSIVPWTRSLERSLARPGISR